MLLPRGKINYKKRKENPEISEVFYSNSRQRMLHARFGSLHPRLATGARMHVQCVTDDNELVA